MRQMGPLHRKYVRFVRWLRRFARAVAVKKRREQPALNALEAERLDRIRNPSKYLGKPQEAAMHRGFLSPPPGIGLRPLASRGMVSHGCGPRLHHQRDPF